ncbi:MAG: MurR/RpiR family transcriptional regulator [Devosia sp.]
MDNKATRPSPPVSFDALRAAILERRSDLPKRLTQVAAYALDNPDEIAFGTAASIAEAARVQASTLVRFAQHFGFDGFSSLQRVFRSRLREKTSSYEERLRLLEQDSGAMPESMGILSGFITAGHRSLDALVKAVEPEAIEKATEILAGARTIYLIAKRRSYPVSAYMAYAFAKLRVPCIAVGTASGIDDDLLALAGPRDAAFAISFSPYATETVNQARALAERGAPVISLTDSAFSPLAGHSAVLFEVAESDHAGFRSLSASMAFAMALTVGIAEKRRLHRSSQSQS